MPKPLVITLPFNHQTCQPPASWRIKVTEMDSGQVVVVFDPLIWITYCRKDWRSSECLKAGIYVSDLLLRYELSRPLRWSGTGLFTVPGVQTKNQILISLRGLIKCVFIFRFPFLYTTYLVLRSAPALSAFKSGLRLFGSVPVSYEIKYWTIYSYLALLFYLFTLAYYYPLFILLF